MSVRVRGGRLASNGKRRRRDKLRPAISVVVVVYNLAREAPRTLLSLSADYQRHIPSADYEVIVVDNGSNPPFDRGILDTLRGNFRLIRIDPAPPSPAVAVNRGIAEARGEVIGVMIDGARIATPGLLHFARHGVALYRNAVVTTLGWYLGHDVQRFAIEAGYDKAREDALLASIGWPKDGYRLFEIGTPDESSFDGWFRPLAESNALFLRRGFWRRLGGMDERFASPGGGLVNLDIYARAIASRDAQAVILLGEGTFHQVHGGIATNAPVDRFKDRFGKWDAEYHEIRGRRWSTPSRAAPPSYIGMLPSNNHLAHFVRSAMAPVKGNQDRSVGAGFDAGLWGVPAAVSDDPAIAAVVDLARGELRAGDFAAATGIARALRKRAPDEPEALRILSVAPSSLDIGTKVGSDHHAAMGDAWRLLGETKRAEESYCQAIESSTAGSRAYVGLAGLRLSGEGYRWWLERFYGGPLVRTVMEIGIGAGGTLACVPKGRTAIGVDPKLDLEAGFLAEVHLFPETSDAFFARRGPDALLAGAPVDIGFIDGLHAFEQALRDFVNLERYCGPHSIILIHDTMPLDEVTQRPERQRDFYTGDVWKVVPCLRALRPDLEVFTIATPYSGLTAVAGLDQDSRVLADRYEEAVARFAETPYAFLESDMESKLAIVPNAWEPVLARLKALGIPVGVPPLRGGPA